MVLGWLSYEKPMASPERSAMMRMPSAAPTIDPTMASSALWKVAPRLLLKATTARLHFRWLLGAAGPRHGSRHLTGLQGAYNRSAKNMMVFMPSVAAALMTADEGECSQCVAPGWRV